MQRTVRKINCNAKMLGAWEILKTFPPKFLLLYNTL